MTRPLPATAALHSDRPASNPPGGKALKRAREKETDMSLKRNLIKAVVLTTVAVIAGIASVLGADTRRAVKR